jgi:hypothetical protein
VKSKCLLAIVLVLGTGFALLLSHSRSKMGATPGPSTQTGSPRYDIKQAYGQLPLSFEVIPGARNGEAKAIARGRGLNLFLIGSDAIMAVGNDDPENTNVVRMRVQGAIRRLMRLASGDWENTATISLAMIRRIGALTFLTLNASFCTMCTPESTSHTMANKETWSTTSLLHHDQTHEKSGYHS